MSDYSFFKCKYLKKQEIRDEAEKFRKNYWTENLIPVNIEKIFESKLGMNIEPLHFISDSMHIDAYLKPDFSGIVVDYDQYMDNENRYENRLRFSFAHEIGHFILHKYIYDNFVIYNSKEYYNFITNAPVNEYKSFEWQANEFAGRLLVPPVKLKSELDNIFIKFEENDLTEILKNDPDYILERITPKLSKPFGVSEKVIQRRVKEENLWPPNYPE